jgi:hypothetical protein
MRYLVVVLLLIPFDVLSQTTPRQAIPYPTKQEKKSLTVRQDALSAAEQVIEQIKDVDDLQSRVELAEKIVKLLAKKRPERLRTMLNAIFDDAISLKMGPPKNKAMPPDLDSILRRLIETAALIDVEFARGYIETLSNLRASDGIVKTASNSTLYLKIATELSRSNPSLAVDVATRSLADGILADTLLCLVSLRQVDVVAANRFFITALLSCQTRGAKDINELLLLFSYVFSPPKVPAVVSQGLAVLNIPGYSDEAKNNEPDAAMARLFLKTATDILLDTLRYSAGNIERLAFGVEGDFYALTILEPWVATYESNKASTISTQRNSLMNYMQAGQRETAFSNADRWKNSPKEAESTSGSTQTLEYLTSKAETASDPKRKDQLYFRAALTAVRSNKREVALSLVERISTENSEKAKQFIKFQIALQHIQNQQFSEADKLARMDDVLARRAYIFTLIADGLTQEKHNDSSRALQYLDEVQQLAGKLSNEKERLSVAIGAANVYARLDTIRAAEILQQIIKYSNKVEDFVGDSSIANVLEIGGFYFDYSIYSNGLNIFDLIQRLAAVSYYATLQDIRSLTNRILRLQAIIALCSTVILDETHTVRAFKRINKSPFGVVECRPDYLSAAREAQLSSHRPDIRTRLLSVS